MSGTKQGYRPPLKKAVFVSFSKHLENGAMRFRLAALLGAALLCVSTFAQAREASVLSRLGGILIISVFGAPSGYSDELKN
ncbi:MAG: hypothetical protein P8Q92_17035 [Pseudoprimorskyibacter sp.]|nr:hypothetical protein [Pseudoprimorskyibacter sp.]